MKSLLTFMALSALLCVQASTSAEESARLLAQIEPRIKAIYETDEFRMRSFGATWLPDGSGYLKLETPAGSFAVTRPGNSTPRPGNPIPSRSRKGFPRAAAGKVSA